MPLSDFMPNVGSINIPTTSIIQYLMYGVMALLLLVVLYKLSTHRILIKKYIVVDGGLVQSSTRCNYSYDKDSKLHYLKSMWGNKKLPNFDTKYFQKVDGMPFFGIKRQLSIVLPNEYSPHVSIPPRYGDISQTKPTSVKRWHYMDQRAKFIKKFNKGDIAAFLVLYTPIFIIIASVIFFAFVVWQQKAVTDNVGVQINRLTDTLIMNFGK